MNKNHSKQFMSRRRWIGLTLVGGTGLAVLPPLVQDTPHQIIRSILTAKLKPADIPPETYDKFIQMFKDTGHYDGAYKAYRLFSTLVWLYPTGVLHRTPKLSAKIHAIEESVITHFTMSTNFFFDEAVRNGEKPVLFTSYWRLRACNNPFATFDTT